MKSLTLKGFGLDQGQLLNLVAPLVLSGIKDWSGIVAGNLAHMWAFLRLGVMLQFPHQFQGTKILQERNEKCNQTSPEFVVIISPTPLTPLDPTVNMKVLQITFQGALIMRICYYKDMAGQEIWNPLAQRASKFLFSLAPTWILLTGQREYIYSSKVLSIISYRL